MCKNATNSIVLLGKHLSDMLPIQNDLKHGHNLSSSFFNFPLEYTFRRNQVNQDGLKLNCTNQLLVYADIRQKYIYYKEKKRLYYLLVRILD
jgi:hypothetical protein